MNKTQNLLVMGTAVMGIAYTPAPKEKPSQEVISKYITTHTSKWKYNPQCNYQDNQRSEERKRELLADIRSIRAQIRKQAQEIMLQEDTQIGKVAETLLCKMHTRTCQRIHKVMTQRAEEINVPRKYLSEEKILRRKQILVVDMTELA